MMNRAMIFWLTAALITATQAVKIINLTVPSQYVLETNIISEPFILDCEYDLPVDEKGLVLKWHLNEQLIYQWISTVPSRIFVHNLIRSSVVLNHTVDGYNNHPSRHCTLSITKPTINMSGTFVCSVGTFESEDKRSSHIQIIVPESQFLMKVKEEMGDFIVECSAHGIFPQPKLTIRIGEENNTIREIIPKTDKNATFGLWDIHISAKVKRHDIAFSPSDFHCVLIIPNTTYSRQKQILKFTNQGSQLSAHTNLSTIGATLMFVSLLLLYSG